MVIIFFFCCCPQFSEPDFLYKYHFSPLPSCLLIDYNLAEEDGLMNIGPVSIRTKVLLDSVSPSIRFFNESIWARRFSDPDVCDFTLGNPHEVALPAYVKALQEQVIPRDKHWYAYKRNEPEARSIVADSLYKSHGLPFTPDDVFMTNGAISALAVVINTITDPDDEIIYYTPPWLLYDAMIKNSGGVPVKLKLMPEAFDLDLNAMDKAITKKTRAIIINSPHNPTGRIYQPEQLETLARMLSAAGKRNGRTIYLISDEAYRNIVFDGRAYHSPVTFYPESFLVYTYGKVLLAPGQRIGYIALPPGMTNRRRVREAIPALQMVNGWAFPNALLIHSLNELDRISIDIKHLQAKRDRLVSALREMGYATNLPEGTFYIMVKSPWADDYAYVDLLARHNVFCLPGSLMEISGYFRISLTAGDEMVHRAIPIFAAVRESALGTIHHP